MKKLKFHWIFFSLLFLVGVSISVGYNFKTQHKKKQMTAHIVYFWTSPNLSPADKEKFEAGLRSLLKIKSIKQGYVGKPAATEARDVVDNSFAYTLMLFFDDVKGHDAYQIDPIHLKFVEENKQYWTKVVVYDADTM
ncbi:MAG: hypothetical protein OHK0057_37200 [Thermoflexibacter sp.]